MSDRHFEASFADHVREGLSRPKKMLSPKYLYDELGSILFEAITQLPEYGLWRAEQRLFATHAVEIARNTEATSVIELGSGSATKTIFILQELLRRQRMSYCAVDLSASALELTRRALDGLGGITVRGIRDDYLTGLETALAARAPHTRVLVLFIGSSLGNFDSETSLHFLRRIRRALHVGDNLLLGADLLKPRERLLPAYDDALGITAAFNRNLLVRMNRELGANFVLPQFLHRARFNVETGDVEMHLESQCRQEIDFSKVGFSASFRAGETIHTESSHKYSLKEVDDLAARSGFRLVKRWIDTEWPFVSGLYRAE